jgi:hypothetical protein
MAGALFAWISCFFSLQLPWFDVQMIDDVSVQVCPLFAQSLECDEEMK